MEGRLVTRRGFRVRHSDGWGVLVGGCGVEVPPGWESRARLWASSLRTVLLLSLPEDGQPGCCECLRCGTATSSRIWRGALLFAHMSLAALETFLSGRFFEALWCALMPSAAV